MKIMPNESILLDSLTIKPLDDPIEAEVAFTCAVHQGWQDVRIEAHEGQYIVRAKHADAEWVLGHDIHFRRLYDGYKAPVALLQDYTYGKYDGSCVLCKSKTILVNCTQFRLKFNFCGFCKTVQDVN